MATPFDQALADFISRSAYVLVVQELATKWRLELIDGYLLDLYFNATLGKYSYTVAKGGKRIWGWDNAPHHPALVNFPHHVHQPDGTIAPSALTGQPDEDLREVRILVEAYLASQGVVI
jgi:hypothetical protein